MEEIRKQIDILDSQIKELIMLRMDQAALVAEFKVSQGETTIYRADREAQILTRLGEGVPQIRKAEYLAVVRKIMEVCRMYEYDLMFDLIPGVLDSVMEGVTFNEADTHLKIHFMRPDTVNSLSAVLTMIGDYGCSLKEIHVGEKEDSGLVPFEITFMACIKESAIQKLLFQLSKETQNLHIVESF